MEKKKNYVSTLCLPFSRMENAIINYLLWRKRDPDFFFLILELGIMNTLKEKLFKGNKEEKEDKIKVASWKNGVTYVVGDHVRFRGKVYECLVEHLSSKADSPLQSANWSKVAEDSRKPIKTVYSEADSGDEVSSDDEAYSAKGDKGKDKVKPWKSKKSYVSGDKVRFRGKVYTCLVDHTSDKTVTPLTYPENWSTDVVVPIVPDIEPTDSTVV